MSIGDKFKEAERALDNRVPAGGFIVIRLDGKAFHTFTKSFEKPFDQRITDAMNAATEALCLFSDIPVDFAYTQSDEISLVLDNRKAQTWMGGRVQKIVSVAASYTTIYFSRGLSEDRIATFDARVMHLDTEQDVYSYLLWRKRDANRNALSALAQAHFSHKELQGKGKNELFEMVAWKAPESLPIPERDFNGRYFYPTTVLTDGVDHLSGAPVKVERTSWRGRNDEKMLATFADRFVNYTLP